MEDVKYISSTSELHEHIGRNEPCVYRVPQESRLLCQTKWTRDYLTKTIGSKEVTVRGSASKKYVDPAEGFWSLVRAMLVYKMTMMDFLNIGVPRGMIISGTDTYLFHDGIPNPAWANVWEDAKDLTDSAGLADEPGFFPSGSLHTVGLWVSGKGIKSILHYDDSGDNNVNFQIRGEKRILLFPPSDWPKLETMVALSLHDLDAYADIVDDADKVKQLGKLEGTHPVVAHLQEHDVLYIPSRWYHYVKHEGDFNVNMTCWFEREALSTEVEEGGGVTIPQRSCSDYAVVFKMVSVFLVSTLLNFVRKVTGIRFSDERGSR